MHDTVPFRVQRHASAFDQTAWLRRTLRHPHHCQVHCDRETVSFTHVGNHSKYRELGKDSLSGLRDIMRAHPHDQDSLPKRFHIALEDFHHPFFQAALDLGAEDWIDLVVHMTDQQASALTARLFGPAGEQGCVRKYRTAPPAGGPRHPVQPSRIIQAALSSLFGPLQNARWDQARSSEMLALCLTGRIARNRIALDPAMTAFQREAGQVRQICLDGSSAPQLDRFGLPALAFFSDTTLMTHAKARMLAICPSGEDIHYRILAMPYGFALIASAFRSEVWRNGIETAIDVQLLPFKSYHAEITEASRIEAALNDLLRHQMGWISSSQHQEISLLPMKP